MSGIHPVLLVLVDPRPIAITSKKSRITHDADPLARELHLRWLLSFGCKELGLHQMLAVHFERPPFRPYSELATSLSAINTAPQGGVVVGHGVAGLGKLVAKFLEGGIIGR